MWIERHGPTWRIRSQVGGDKFTIASGLPSKSAAKERMKVLAADEVRGELVTPAAGKLTVGEWATAWWDARKSGLAPNTQHSEWSRIRSNIIPPLGHYALSAVTQMIVQTWASELGKTRSPKTVHNCHGMLYTIMAAAVAARKIRTNPCADTKLPRGEVSEMRFLTEPEAQRLVEAIPEHYRPLVVTAIGTGLRWGELAGLRVKRVDVLAGRLVVEETLSELAGSGEIVFGVPKTRASRRTVSLPAEVRQALVPLVSNRGREDLVFLTVQGFPLRTRNFRRVWLTATKRAGLAGLRFHDLRHSHVAWLLSSNTSPTAVQRRLGHATISVTSDRYGHLLPEVDDRIIAVLDGAMPRVDGGDMGGAVYLSVPLSTSQDL